MRSRRWLLRTGASAILAAFLLAVLHWLPPRWRSWAFGSRARIARLAVLPLTNLSKDIEQEYFADGMTDILIADLAEIGSLRVLLPTHYSDAWLGLLSNPVQVDDMVKGAISALAYATVFLAWAWYRFARKDVVS